jgi:hypothetical protein
LRQPPGMRETAGLVTNNLYHDHPEGEEQE